MISIVIPLAGTAHADNLEYMIENFKRQTMKDYELILVEQVKDSCESVFEKFDCYRHIAVFNNDLFHRNWLMNIGAKTSRGEKILFIDADITFRSDYLKMIVEFQKPWFVGWSKMYYFDADISQKIKYGFYPKDIMDFSKDTMKCDTMAACGAATCVDKEFFFDKYGGFNENYFGWGAEDNDNAIRANTILGKFNYMDYNVGHLSHQSDRIKCREKATSPENMNQFHITCRNPNEITRRILLSGIGKLSGPTTINVSDIK